MVQSQQFAATSGVDNAGTGTVVWNSPNNIILNDGNNGATSFPNGGQQTHYLFASGFPFQLNPAITLLGIQVDVMRRVSAGSAVDNAVSLFKAGSASGPNKGDTVNGWGISIEHKTYGGPQDLWGGGFGVADINNPGFGVGISGSAPSGFPDLFLYYAQITVYYDTGTSFGPVPRGTFSTW
jgi:hypothetical protein